MAAYYNEIDPYAAARLRQLIRQGFIPPGEVDERSILDVAAGDLAQFNQCHFFAGIGGWSYAIRLAGCLDETPVWTGSCPCQPLSSAGRRQGPADERHLWPAFYRLIAECRPATIFGEQVASKDGREWLAGVRVDLEGLGYAIGAADLPAACVGLPHQRQRLFWGANLYRAGASGGGRSDRTDQEATERATPKTIKSRDRRFSELVTMGVAQWSPSYSEARNMVDGIPYGLDQLRALGNAIVPEIGAEFIAAFYDSLMDVLVTPREHQRE